MLDFPIFGLTTLYIVDGGEDDGVGLCVKVHVGEALVYSMLYDITPVEHMGADDYATAWYNVPSWLMDCGLSWECAWDHVQRVMEEDPYASDVLHGYLNNTRGVRTGRFATPQP